MRIGQFTDTFLPVVDGVGRVAVAYAETLSGMGHQVTVSTPMYDTGFRGGYPYELVDFTGFKVPTSPQYKTGSPVLDSHYRARMDMIPFDIVHAHSPFAAGKEALRIARQRHVPLVATFHSKYYDDFLKVTRSETLSKAWLKSVIDFYKRCDEVWAVSRTSALVLKDYGYKGQPLVMTNGTTRRNLDSATLERIELEYQLNGMPVFLFVGQISWKKNILRILEAAAELRKTTSAFHLLLAGQGEDRKDVQKKIQELGLENNARLIGMIQDTAVLDALYKRARLFVFPSLYDTFSLVIREAAAMGTPSVAVMGSCAAEDIRDGENGFLCQDETESLLPVLKKALLEPELMAAVGENAQHSLPVTWAQVMQSVEERYLHLIKHYHRKPHASHQRYQRKLNEKE